VKEFPSTLCVGVWVSSHSWSGCSDEEKIPARNQTLVIQLIYSAGIYFFTALELYLILEKFYESKECIIIFLCCKLFW
jgi:hypothetical protein